MSQKPISIHKLTSTQVQYDTHKPTSTHNQGGNSWREGQGGLAPPPPPPPPPNFLPILNIIRSHIKSQYCRSTTAPFCTRKVTSPPPPPPTFRWKLPPPPPLKMTHTSQQVYTMTHTRQQVHTMTHTRQQVHTMTYKTTMTHMWQSQVENEH